MKTLLFISLSAMILAQAPHPVPVPTSGLSSFAGVWYVLNAYDRYENKNYSSQITCYAYNVSIDSNTTGLIDSTLIFQGDEYHTYTPFTTLNQANQWSMFGSVWDWIALDPVSGQWGTLADNYDQKALLVSKTANLSSLIINAQLALLKGEGYDVNSTSFVTFNQTGCPQ